MRNWAIRAIFVTVAAVLALAVSAFKADAAPVTCRIGAYVTSIHDVETATGTFKADFWMWSICPTPDASPLKTMEFLNAEETTGGLDATLERDGTWWSTRKVTGNMRAQGLRQKVGAMKKHLRKPPAGIKNPAMRAALKKELLELAEQARRMAAMID